MNNFIFQNSTKVYFGKGCVKEYLTCLTKNAQTILLAYGGGSIKRNGVYDEITGILKGAGKTIVEFSGIYVQPHLRQSAGGCEAGTGQSSGYDSGRRRRQHHGLLQSCLSGCPV